MAQSRSSRKKWKKHARLLKKLSLNCRSGEIRYINVPRTIVLIIDYSGSQLPFIKNSVAAAKVLVDKLGPKDLMAIVTDDVELLLD